jgi:hypothetical protein
MTASPGTLQLRYLQTLTEIATERNSTVIFPFPIDLVLPVLAKLGVPQPASPAPKEKSA